MPSTLHRTLVLLTLALLGCGQKSAVPLAAGPSVNVLVILIDTLRADHLGSYGYPHSTSPFLDKFAAQSTLYERAWAQASSTSPSHGSIFTSTYPRVHGVWNRTLDPNGEAIFPRLASKAITLAEVFQEGGYATAAITDGGNVTESRGFGQGFDSFEAQFKGVRNRVERAKDWLQEERTKPFFLFLHTYQVHTPYIPEAKFVEKFGNADYHGPYRKAWRDALEFSKSNQIKNAIRVIQQKFYRPHHPKEGEGPPSPDDLEFLIALYDAEIGTTDAALEDFLTWAEKEGHLKNTLVVITSDHGEEFWEHDQYGHHQVYDHTLQVPLLVRTPGQIKGVRRPENVELIDLMPSLLSFAGLPIPPSVMGRTLKFGEAIKNGDTHTAIAETNWPEAQIGVRQGDTKAMLFPNSNRHPEVYFLTDDAGEIEDQIGQPRGKYFLGQTMNALQSWEILCKETQSLYQLAPALRNIRQLSPERLAELQALGYVSE